MHVAFPLPMAERYTSSTGGAIATVTHHLAVELGARGHRVTVLTPDDGQRPFRVGGTAVPLSFGPAHPLPLWQRAANRLLPRGGVRRWRVRAVYQRAVVEALRGDVPEAVVVANDPVLAQTIATSFPRTTCVLWLHNLLAPHEGDLAALDPSVTIVAVSAAVADWSARQHRIDRDRITVVHNGVDAALFRPAPRGATGGTGATGLRVVCHGRIDPNKGFDLAARAVARLRAEGVAVSLTVVGEVQTFGMAAEDVDRYVADLDRVLAEAGARRLGRLPHHEVAAVLREHDAACVVPRSQEPFSLACLEAMASGCAVVAARIGGLPEVVDDPDSMVSPGDVAQIVDALRLLATDPELLSRRRRAARRRAEELSWAATAAHLIALLPGPVRPEIPELTV